MESEATTAVPWILTKDDGIRAVSGISSALSVIGSMLIILSYYCFRDLRTRARLILVHLAFTDMGVGLSNLIGILADFDRFYTDTDTAHFKPNSTSIDNLCKTQAFFALFFTISSVLWTSCLAVYMYLLIVTKNQKQMKMFLWFSYVFCYGMSLFVTLWMMFTGRLGYAPFNSSGWCSTIIFVKDRHVQHKLDYMADAFGYDLWIYLTIILTVILYVSVFIYVRLQYSDMYASADTKLYWQAMHNIDYKFIMIPLMLIFLRIWAVIVNIYEFNNGNTNSFFYKVLLYFAGIGDSGQGFVNAILFVLFTHSVRKRIFSCACFKCFKRSPRRGSVQETSIYSDNKYLINSHEGLQNKIKKYHVPEAVETVGNSQSMDRPPSVTPTSYSSGKY